MNTQIDQASPRHFLDLKALPAETLRSILDLSWKLREAHVEGHSVDLLQGKTLVSIFEKPSTRTRISFEVAMRQLGGHVITLNSSDMQLGRGETIGDTARVLSRYGDVVMLRTTKHSNLQELADNATIPVINGLTDLSHPCQIMADLMTLQQHKGSVQGLTVAWVGDCNNVAESWVHAAALFGFKIKIATPPEFAPTNSLKEWAAAQKMDLFITTKPEEAVEGADCVVTDTWVSMNNTDRARRLAVLQPYRVDDKLMAQAKEDAIFLHCLPAHRGEEVSASVLDGAQSVVWDEAENRLHAQKGIIAWCLGHDSL